MDEEEEEMERNINNITCDASFQYPVTKSVQKKDASYVIYVTFHFFFFRIHDAPTSFSEILTGQSLAVTILIFV